MPFIVTRSVTFTSREHPEIPPALASKLRSLYSEWNEKFFGLVGRRFDWNDRYEIEAIESGEEGLELEEELGVVIQEEIDEAEQEYEEEENEDDE